MTVLLFRRESAGLDLHGVLPVGGYNGERFGDSYDDGFSWKMVEVKSTVGLASGGCLKVKSTASRDTWPDTKGNRKSKKLSVPAADPVADGVDQGVYDFEIERDFSGAWKPTADGGFERVEACGSSPTSSGALR